ncbi:MAG: beta-ketoacyl-[acyl-carrier-protein] synthase family protein, partial [Chthoniobacterales bacterium]
RSARDCVTPVNAFDVSKTRCKTAAQIDDVRLLPRTAKSRRDRRLHRASHMVITALDELLQQAHDFTPEIAIVGTTSGGMTFGESFYRSLGDRGECAAARIANYPPQKQIADALEKFGIEAPAQVIANACASGTNAIGLGFSAIRSGRHERVLVGGYDAISELVFVGFDSLQAATPEKCRPFDANRSGMVLGEGAALLALEDFDSAQHRGANIIGEIAGYGISTDNHHLTQPNPDGSGPRRAMEQAVAAISPGQIGYINAHGTATIFNDSAEGKAIAEVFGNGVPVSSTKSMMGHSLGAAGAIEAIVSLLALQHQFLPPNINFEQVDPSLALNIVANDARDAQLEYALSNSFGFGGINATVVLRNFPCHVDRSGDISDSCETKG